MMHLKILAVTTAVLVMGSLPGLTQVARAQTGAATNGPFAQIVVTAEPRHGKDVPALTQKDVTISSGKDQLEIVDWLPAEGQHAGLQLFLLMDDSSNSNIGTQFTELKQFITGLPPSTEIAIGYMRNGTTDLVQNFTTDHATAATRLRLPLGMPGVNASPYFSLTDLYKKWPASNMRREILMITDGVDRFYGGGPDNPYVETAYTQAQRAGIILSSIYWSSIGHFGHSYFAINWGQNYLSQIADATGGEAYWQGFGNPVSFEPFLEDFAARLSHQYLLVFRPKVINGKPGAERIRVRTELKDVDLVAPSAAFAPGSK